MDRDKLKAEVLDWVNEQRARVGFAALTELPKATGTSTDNCVVARAFEDIGEPSVGYSTGDIYSRVTGKPILSFDGGDLPHFVTEFIRAFCRGKYPELGGVENCVIARSFEDIGE